MRRAYRRRGPVKQAIEGQQTAANVVRAITPLFGTIERVWNTVNGQAIDLRGLASSHASYSKAHRSLTDAMRYLSSASAELDEAVVLLRRMRGR